MKSSAWRDPLTWVVAAAVAFPAVVAGIVALGRSGALASDMALINLRLGDVFTADTPLLGPFSRYDWNHPGPLMFWLLAPVYRLLGGGPGAMWASGAFANAVGLVGLVVLFRRFGGRQLLVVGGLGAALLVWGTGTVLADPWNPYLAMVPFAVFLVAAAAIAAGDLVLIPVAVFVGSFLVQTHVGYALLVAGLGTWAVAGLVVVIVRRRRGGVDVSPGRIAVVVGASVVVAALAWSGPIVEQATNDPGNLTRLVDYFTASDGDVTGVDGAISVTGRELSLLGPWLGGAETADDGTSTVRPTSGWWALPALAALAAALVVAVRRRDLRPAAFLGTVAVGIGLAVVATSRISDLPYFYIVRFWWPLAMSLWVGVGWVAARMVVGRVAAARVVSADGGAARTVPTWLTPVVVAIFGVVVVVNGVALAQEPAPLPGADAVAAVVDDTVAALDPDGTYLVVPLGWSLFGELFGMVDALDARGVTVATHPRFGIHFTDRRVLGRDGAPTDFDGTIVVAASGSPNFLRGKPGYREVAAWDPLSSTEREELEGYRALVRTRLADAGLTAEADAVADGPVALVLAGSDAAAAASGLDAAERYRIAELEARGIPISIFVVDRFVDPDRIGLEAAAP